MKSTSTLDMSTRIGWQKNRRVGALVLVGVLLGSLLPFGVGPQDVAQASHLRGGLVTAEYHAHGGGEVHLEATMLAALNNSASFSTVSVQRVVDGGSPTTVTGCSGTTGPTVTSIANPYFEIRVSEWTVSGCLSTPGQYIFSSTVNARISGIANSSSSSNVQFEVAVNIDGATDSAAPTYSSGYMYNIAYSDSLNYSTNMNGLGQGNSAVTYELITSTASSLGGYGATQIPCSDLNTATGQFRINEDLCTGSDTISSKFSGGKIYALKVKATDSAGQYATRDVLLNFGNTLNNAPTFSATTPYPGSLAVTPGSTATITLSATDSDTADVLDFTQSPVVSWITRSSVTNEVVAGVTVYSITYTLAPPLGTNETVQFEISVFDDDNFSLSSSVQYDIEAGGVLPPGQPGDPTLTPAATSIAVSFVGPNSGGTVASYRADVTPTLGGSTTGVACATPPATTCAITGLASETSYSVVIVAINASGTASSNAVTTVTLVAPPAPPPAAGRPAVVTSPPDAPATPRLAQRTPVTPPAPVTGPVVRSSPQAPAPNQPVATVGGRPRVLQTQVTNDTSLSLRSGVFNLGWNVQPGQGSIRQNPEGNSTELEVRNGGSSAVAGSGVLPGSTVQVFMSLSGNDSKEVARIPVDATGAFSGDALFGSRPTERPLPIGRHVMQIVSVDATGQQAVVEMAVNIAQPAPAPEVDRQAGQTPELRPGQFLATNGGDPEVVTVTPQPDQKQATIQGDSWSMSVSIAGQGGAVAESDEGEVLVEFIRNESAQISGSGFMPGSRADVWLFSDPTLLGSVTIDENGEFNGEVNVDGNVVTIGEHTLQLQGVGEDGFVRAANLGVVVNDTELAAGATEEAAANFLWLLWLIVGLVAVTAAFLLWRWRESRNAI